ncbi:MAG: hypothetical protein ACT6UH_07565 [Hydrogenophaga sp.]|jgi:hypothetical protein|uniref:hypothetical protein n=1 Tax=unclassified Hydrogenophaga TaxID=2610897 RepID=UPI0036D2E0D9
MAPRQVVLRRLKGPSRPSRLVMVRNERQMQDAWGSQVVREALLELQTLQATIRKKMP